MRRLTLLLTLALLLCACHHRVKVGDCWQDEMGEWRCWR